MSNLVAVIENALLLSLLLFFPAASNLIIDKLRSHFSPVNPIVYLSFLHRSFLAICSFRIYKLADYNSLIFTISLGSRIHTLFNQKAIMPIPLKLCKKLLIICLLLQHVSLFPLPCFFPSILKDFSGVVTCLHGSLASSLFFCSSSLSFKTVKLILF